MGGGNAQKSATARARKLEKDKAAKGGVSQLKTNLAANNIIVRSGVVEDGLVVALFAEAPIMHPSCALKP